VNSPYESLGGAEKVRALVEDFYDLMEANEPALAALHQRDPDGHVSRRTRERFGLFLIGWLGGPQDYTMQHGHPRLRMRHGRVPVHSATRDAWLRSMRAAMDRQGITGSVRKFLEARFAEVADFLRNHPEP
jgi:hemoglobin